jgi:hypothetical protein
MLAVGSPALYQQQGGLATLPSEFQGACFSGDVPTIQRFLTAATTGATASATTAGATAAGTTAAVDGAAAVSVLC